MFVEYYLMKFHMCTFFFNAIGPISRRHFDSTNHFFSDIANKPGANIETNRIT